MNPLESKLQLVRDHPIPFPILNTISEPQHAEA